MDIITNYKIIFRDNTEDTLQVVQYLQSEYLTGKTDFIYSALNYASGTAFYSGYFLALRVCELLLKSFVFC